MKYISILLMMLILGCAGPKDKVTVTYGDWQTDRFIISSTTEDAQVDLSKFQDGKIKYITVKNEDLAKKPGEEVTVTYRRVEKIICTDHNCTMEESYEIK